MVDLPSRPLAEIDPEFEKVALETGELTYGLPGLSTREKFLLCLANDVCREHLGLALRMHVQAALDNNVSYEDMLALVRFVAPYAGYPAAADAMAQLAAAAGQFGVDTSPQRATDGGAPGERVDPGYGRATTDDWMAGFIASRTTRAWAETRLSPCERAYLAIAVDIAQQTLGPSFARHVQLALDAGASADQVRDAVRFTAEFGVVKAAVAVDTLAGVLPGSA